MLESACSSSSGSFSERRAGFHGMPAQRSPSAAVHSVVRCMLLSLAIFMSVVSKT